MSAIPWVSAIPSAIPLVGKVGVCDSADSLFRSEERIATEKRHLKRKWKAHIRFENYKRQDRVAMDAPRRQSVKV